MKLKSNYKDLGVRVVPHAVARYGAFIASGVIMMPSYISILALMLIQELWLIHGQQLVHVLK